MKTKNYWTFEKCQEKALKYSSRTEFSINYKYVYMTARRNV